jgi:predicted Zn-dependent protease
MPHLPALLIIAGICCATSGAARAQETILLPDIGDSAGAVISPEQEKRVGEEYMRQLRRLAPMVTDEEVEDYIQALGTSMSTHAGYDTDFHFYMLESPVINAFALPGGFITIHTGLMLETQTESELASVVGHEISHVTQRHGARMFEEASQMSGPMIASMIGALILTAVNPQAGAAALMAGQAAAQQHQINFTRANEHEADALGIQLMHEAGYDVDKMAVFFERMQRASRYTDPAYIPEYLRTHPITVNRIAEARSRAENIEQQFAREDSYRYYLIKAKLKVMGESDPIQAVNYFHAQLSEGDFARQEAARYGYALALIEAGDFDRARMELDKLMTEYPNIISFRLAYGQLEQRARNFNAALGHFEQAYKMEPETRAAVYGYINALLLVGRAVEAKRLLGEYGLAERRDPRFYKLLADAETRLGEQANAHHSLAEYYLTVGEFPYAAEQLRLARETPGLSNYQRQKIVARLEEVEDRIRDMEDEEH